MRDGRGRAGGRAAVGGAGCRDGSGGPGLGVEFAEGRTSPSCVGRPQAHPLEHLSLQRKRHYWRLDCKCITLFQNNTTNRYYKVGLPAALFPQISRLCPPPSLSCYSSQTPVNHTLSHPLPAASIPSDCGPIWPPCLAFVPPTFQLGNPARLNPPLCTPPVKGLNEWSSAWGWCQNSEIIYVKQLA